MNSSVAGPAKVFSRLKAAGAFLGSIALVLIASGCVSPARRLDPSVIRKIQPNVSTRADVEKLLGKPRELIMGPAHKTVARYWWTEALHTADSSRERRRTNPGDVLFRSFTVLYQPAEVVKRKLHDESVTPALRDEYHVTVGHRIDSSVLDRVSKGATTMKDLLALLGEPTARTLSPSGNVVLIWVYAQEDSRHRGFNTDFQKFVVGLDENDRVADFAVWTNPSKHVFSPLLSGGK